MIYLDNAATTYKKPPGVLKELARFYGNPGRGGHNLSLEAGNIIFDCREKLANFFGVSSPAQIVFTPNTTAALNIVIKGLLKPGDHAIISGMEHNSVSRPAYSTGAEISVALPDETGCITVDAVAEQIRSNTRLIAITHASNICGTVNPIREIGALSRDNNILFLVDSAQTAGLLPINVEEDNIDFLAFAGHKMLYGPQGTGGLYISSGAEISPLIEGGTGSLSESLSQPEALPDKFESGTLNTGGIHGLLEGVRFIEQETIQSIQFHENNLTNDLLNGLMNIPKVKVYGRLSPEGRTGVLGFNVDEYDCVELCSALNSEYGIASRAGLHCAALAHKSMGTEKIGMVRFSVSYFTKKSDVTKALVALNTLAK